MSLILAALLGAVQPAPATDAIASAANGLVAAIEQDDLDPQPRVATAGEAARPEPRFESITTTGCESRLTGTGGRAWTLDWRRIEVAALTENFIFIRAPDLSLAIVADVSMPGQGARLVALVDAMHVVHARCNPAAPARWR